MQWHPTSLSDQKQFDPAEVFAAGLRAHHIANTAYPIGHLTTMRPYRAPSYAVQQIAEQDWDEVDRLGLYVHVPFCEARCGYCEYCVLDPANNAQTERVYFDLLLREFELYRQAIDTPSKTLIGFDIGGGTPALPEAGQIARVVEAARKHFNLPAEVTISIETTPKIAALQPEKLRAFYAMGIHRISMGVQTIHPRLLEAYGRTSTSLTYNRQAEANIRQAGFTRFNVDVMYGFARQSTEAFEATLRHVISLRPEYITLYRMRYKGTRVAGQAQQVSLGEVVEQYALSKALLGAAGYTGSPGKNTFSRLTGEPGTSDYLTQRVIYGTPYLGLGLGAQSLAHKTLAYNCGAAEKRLQNYQRHVEEGRLPIQDIYHLSRPAAMAKMISVSFYFGEVNLPAFCEKFGLSLEQAFPAEVEFLLKEGLMEYHTEGRGIKTGSEPLTLRLTALGEKKVNGVIALFYAGAVKEYLIQLTKDQVASTSKEAEYEPQRLSRVTVIQVGA